MLPRRKRVGKQPFQAIFKEGTTFHSPHLLLKVIEGGEGGRFSVATGKNSARKAAERNKMRRRGYALLLKQLPVWPKHARGVLFIKKDAPLRRMEEELTLLLKRAGLK